MVVKTILFLVYEDMCTQKKSVNNLNVYQFGNAYIISGIFTLWDIMRILERIGLYLCTDVKNFLKPSEE
jgi:hypothetical protein